MRRKVHYVIEPQYLWGNIAEMARKQDDELLRTLQKGFKYIEESPSPAPSGPVLEINLASDKLGKTLHRAQRPPVQDHRRDCQGAGAVLYR